ncbi:MAG: hypothetical protein JXN62_04245 [Bacteroidales bacterium]|nr:hypothetical protein [Bacteroidales bacterium]
MGKTLSGFIDLLESGEIDVLMSLEGKEELLDVLQRKKLKKYFDEKRKIQVERFLLWKVGFKPFDFG